MLAAVALSPERVRVPTPALVRVLPEAPVTGPTTVRMAVEELLVQLCDADKFVVRVPKLAGVWPRVTLPEPAAMVMPPEPMFSVLAAVLVPPARKLVAPLVLKVRDAALRVAFPSEMKLESAFLLVMLKNRFAVVVPTVSNL